MDSSYTTTPYGSALCSPRSSTDKAPSGDYSVRACTCPLTIKYDIRPLPAAGMDVVVPSPDDACSRGDLSSEDFDFSARFSETEPPWSPTPMSSADELFYNGQIRPLWYNCEDLAHISFVHGSKSNTDDEDSHFDFRSSADYMFSMFSTAHSTTAATGEAQMQAGYGYNEHSLDECSVHKHRQVNKDGNEDAGERESTKKLVPKCRASRQGLDEMIAKQLLMVKVEESRERLPGGYKEGGIRRSRSLSPLRVFHMDDELPRHSVESSKVEPVKEHGTQMVRIKGRRLTLKELLHSSSRTEHTINQKKGEKMQNKPCMEMDSEISMMGERAVCFKPTARKALESKPKVSKNAFQHLLGHQASIPAHSLRYMSHTDQTRQQTFLPYRHGLLGCLGFTSKSYCSVGGIQTVHSKSKVTRRSAGYDNSAK